jgi:Laminin G domain
VLEDSEGNPVARGTDVNWRMSGSGSILWRDHLVAGQDGKVEAIITAGTLGGTPQTITVEADGVSASIDIANIPVSVSSLTATPESLDITGSQTATITVTANGVADGTEVTWRTSRGVLSQRSGKIQNGSAQTVLTADSGTVGNANVIAIIGDATADCDVQFTSSAPISVEVVQPLIVRDEPSDGTESLPLLYGGTQSIPFAAETPVIIRAPDHPGEWATVGFAGAAGVSGLRWGFETLDGNLSPSMPAGLSATFADGALLETDGQIINSGEAVLHLPTTSATATIAHAAEVALAEGSGVSFLIRPGEDDGPVLTKAGEYQASLLSDGRLSFTLGSGQAATQVIGTHPLAAGAWHQIDISVRSSRLYLDIAGLTVSTALTAAPPTGTGPLVIGGFTGHLDDLRFHHEQAGFAGISINATGLDSQNRVQLDANGEATIVVSAETVGQGPPPSSLGQTVDVEVSVDQETVTAPKALTVTDKGHGVLIRAIAGKTAVRPLDIATADIAAHAAEFLKYGIRYDDPAAAMPKDMGGDETVRGETGYLIAIWIEERVDEAGIVHPLMSVSAQNLPEEIAKVLNCLLAEMMVSAGQRGDSQSLGDYIIHNNKEFLLALKALSEGNVDQFIQLAKVTDGQEAFGDLSASGNQLGNGLATRIANTATTEINNAFEVVRAAFNRRNSRIKMLSLTEGLANFHHAIRGPILESIQEGDDGMEAVLRDLSNALHDADVIDEKTVAAIGTIYGFVHEANDLTQEAAHPELFAKALPTLLDMLVGAARGNTEALESLKDIGSCVIMAPVNEVPQAADAWDEGQYFNAGRHYAAAAVGGALVAKEIKRSIQRGVYRCVAHGRKLTRLAGMRGEALALAMFRAKGYKEVVPIQNASGHGIDLVMRDRNGGILVVEVKSHLLAARPKVRTNMEDFVKTRLEGALSKTGYWENVDAETLRNAVKFWNEIELKGMKPKGIVVNIDYALTQYPRERYFEWADGLGAEIFDDEF